MGHQYEEDNENTDGSLPDDFANFDPAAYVRKHREQEGQGYLNEDLSADPLPTKGGRRKVSDIEEPIERDRDEGDVGFGAALLGGLGGFGRGGRGMGGMGGGEFRGGRRIGLLAELIGGFGLTRNLFLFVITALLFFACVGLVAIVYVITLLTRR